MACVYYVIAVNTAAKLEAFPASFVTTLAGVIYVVFPLGFLFRIRLEDGPFYLYFLAGIVFLGDTGAFFVGKPFGRHKMTPIASPNKSWEGSAGGFLFAVGGALLARVILLPEVPLMTAILTALVGPRRGPGQRPPRVPFQEGRRGQGLLEQPARARRLPRPDRQPYPGRPALLFHHPLHLEVGRGTAD